MKKGLDCSYLLLVFIGSWALLMSCTFAGNYLLLHQISISKRDFTFHMSILTAVISTGCNDSLYDLIIHITKRLRYKIRDSLNN